MTKNQSDNYKGYAIVTSSSGGNKPPYTASFGVSKVKLNGMLDPVESHVCEGKYNTEDEAHAAANIAARKLIDSKPVGK